MAAAKDAAPAAAAAGGEHHGLSTGWSFWEQRNKKGTTEPWQERTLEVCKFDTVEAFWAVYTLLPTPLSVRTLSVVPIPHPQHTCLCCVLRETAQRSA